MVGAVRARGFSILLMLVGWLGLVPRVGAQSAVRAPSGGADAADEVKEEAAGGGAEAVLREAAAHFQRGMEAFARRAFREAIRAFRLAAERVPSADLWYNIARAHEELGEYEEAVAHYRRYLREKVDPPDRARVEEHVRRLEEQAERLRVLRQRAPTTGVVQVRSSVRGAKLLVDGEPSGLTPLPAPLALERGEHELELRAEGYAPLRMRFTVYPGLTTGLYAEPWRPRRARSVRGSPLWTWVAAGLGVASLGVSGWFGLRALGARRDGDLSRAREEAFRSDVALGAALGFGLSAVVLYFVERRAVETRLEPGGLAGDVAARSGSSATAVDGGASDR